MKIVTIQEIILNGDFGPIKLGATKTEIVEFLGNPQETKNFGGGFAELFYNGFEFFYDIEKNEELYQIHNDNFIYYSELDKGIIEISDSVVLDVEYFLTKTGITYKSVVETLRRDKIEFTERLSNYNSEIILSTDVILFFQFINGDNLWAGFTIKT
jgi:hypothetical protein